MSWERLSPSSPVLVLGASHSELAIYQSIRNLGFEPWGLALHSIHPDVREISAQIVLEDYSDANRVAEVASQIGALALIPGANDLAARTHSVVASNLPYSKADPLNTYLQIHHKDKFRELCENLRIPSPNWRLVDVNSLNLDRDFVGQGPWLLKPTSMSGGKGISFVDGSKLELAQLDFGFSENWIVEDFVSGSLHSAFSVLSEEGLDVVFFADEVLKPGTFHVKDATSPTFLDEDVKSTVTSWLQSVQSHFGLQHGVLHLQFIKGERGPVALELARRPPGDCYLDFVDYSLGLPVTEKLVSSFFLDGSGDPLPAVPVGPIDGRIIRRCRYSDLDEGSPGPNYREIFSRPVFAEATTKVSIEIFSDSGN